MSKISDELRNWFSIDHCGSGLLVSNSECDRLLALADHIDSEMVELPKDRDGVPIHVGDTVRFVGRDDVELKVDHITFFKDKTRVVAMSDEHAVYSNPADFTHGRPDSWERIADELDAWCDRVDVDGDACGKPRDIVERIRKLAEKEDRQCQ